MGEIILDTGAIPRSDIFSFLSFGKPMLAHEWLSEVVFASFYRVYGYVGLSVVGGMLAALVFGVVYRTCRFRGLDALAAAITSALAMRLALVSAGVRPQMFTVVGVALLASALTRATRDGWSRWLWSLPVLFLLWSNMHGGYIIGVVLLWVTWIAGWFSLERSLTRKLGILFTVCTVTTVLTPHGARAWIYPFQYANFGSASLRYILEWQSPNFHDSTTLIMLVVLLVMGVVGVRQAPSIPVDTLWAALFTAMALISNRHIPLFAVVATPIVGARALHDFPFIRRGLAGFDVRVIGVALFFVIPLGALLNLRFNPPADTAIQIGREPVELDVPSGAVREMLGSLPPGNILNEYDWGGYLIYKLYPKWKVGVDGRADVHGDAAMDLNYRLFNGDPDWLHAVDRLGVMYILVRKTGPLATAVEGEFSWRLVYEGKSEKLFARRSAQLLASP